MPTQATPNSTSKRVPHQEEASQSTFSTAKVPHRQRGTAIKRNTPPRDTPEATDTRTYLDLTVLKHRVVEDGGVLDSILVRKLNVRVALGVARKLVAQDGHPVNRPAVSKVGLQLLGGGRVVHAADVDGAGIRLGGGGGSGRWPACRRSGASAYSRSARGVAAELRRGLFLDVLKLGGLLLHLTKALLHSLKLLEDKRAVRKHTTGEGHQKQKKRTP